MKHKQRNKKGFTLIELLVVILIIGVLAAVALPQYSTAVEKSRATEALALMNAVAGAAERYYFQKDAWPTSFTQLDIEVPIFPSSTKQYGGKYFRLNMYTEGSGIVIQAIRQNTNVAPTPDTYTLSTRLVDDSSTETIVRTRSCQGTGKGSTYCDAITNGHNTDF